MRNDFSSKSGRSKASGGKKQPKVRPEVEPKTKSRPSRCKIDFDKLALDATEEELAEWEKRVFDSYTLARNIASEAKGGKSDYQPDMLPAVPGDGEPRVFKDVAWRRVAKLCWHYAVIPEVYVRFCFRNGKTPFPNMLLQEAEIKRCLDRSRLAVEEKAVRLAARSESTIVRARFVTMRRLLTDCTEEEVWYGILLGDFPELSTFCRYVFAAAVGGQVFDAVRDVYEESALWSYLVNSQAYEAVWGDHIPQILRDLACPYLQRRRTAMEVNQDG